MEIRDEIRRVFEAQKAKRWKIAQTSAEERVEKLRRLKAAVLAHRDDLCTAVHADFRKNAAEFELTEIFPVLEELNHAIEHVADWMAPERAKTPLVLAGTKSAIHYEPRGQVLILSPWNYPFNLLFTPLVGAIAAGNCVVLKPSQKTSHVAEACKRTIQQAFSEDEVAIFLGDHRVADELLALPFDHVFFTGSTNIGKKVMECAAKHLATVTLELGGKSPAIVDASADLDAAATRVVWGKCLNAGQTCVAPDYALVHESALDRFVSSAVRVIERFYGASPEQRKRSEDFPRLIDDRAFERVRSLLDRSVEAGAKIAFGGRSDAGERYIEPTILTGVTTEMPIMSEEIFGPVLPVIPVQSADQASEIVRARDKPLAFYLFAQDRGVIDRVLASTTAGGGVVNDAILHVGNPYLPFGGVGASGQGNYHGQHGFRTFSHARAIVERGQVTAVPMFYPPYAERRTDIAHRVLRALE
jgi:aldehyde dehydrogenase (NAD+)